MSSEESLGMRCDLCEDHVRLTFPCEVEHGNLIVSKNACAKCILMESGIKVHSEVRLS